MLTFSLQLGNVIDMMEQNKFVATQTYSMARHLILGLMELHAIGALHYNIKPENILYNSKSNKFMLSK